MKTCASDIGAFAIAAMAAAFGLWSCEGGTIETTNGVTNGISARVVLPSGQPASNIKLKLIDEKDWLAKTKAGESVILDSVVTDSTGKFFIKTDSTVSTGLMADVEDYGILIHDVTQKLLDEAYQGRIGLRKKVTYQGSIPDTGMHASKIFLAGTTFSANVDSVGGFVITDVPQEKYSVVILRNLPSQGQEYIVGAQVTLNEFTEGSHDTVHADTSKVLLLDNFENSENRNLIGQVLGGGWYEAISDFGVGGNAVLLQPANAAPANWISAIKDGGSDHGKSLQVLYKQGTRPGAGQAFSYVQIDLNLGSQNTHYNLSAMDSLTFFSGGSGQLVVELLQQNPVGVSLNVVASKTFTLDQAWSQLTIKPAELKIAIGWFPADPTAYKTALESARIPAYTKPPTTFMEMGGMITLIRFKATGGTEFWLDDVRLHGVNLGDLVK